MKCYIVEALKEWIMSLYDLTSSWISMIYLEMLLMNTYINIIFHSHMILTI